MGANLSLGMVAGEASGDVLAALLLSGMREQGLSFSAHGVGGAHMQAQGLQAWESSDALAVRGYVEVLRHYRRLTRLRDELGRRWLAQPPDVFVGVDAPDFNLALAARLRRSGIKTMHFVCPSIWAWRAQRVHQIKASVDHVLCLFPFEPELLRNHGIPSTYVGHPLASVIAPQPDPAAARVALGLVPDVCTIALLPGSRAAEIQHLLPRFLQTAQLLQKALGRVQFVLPAVPALRVAIDALVAPLASQLSLHILSGQSHAAMASADVVLVASGTATLEVALSGRPMVIAYHMSALSWWLHQRKRLQPWVGLPNILAGEFLVPELLQDEATPEALAQAVLGWLDAPARVQAVQSRFADLHQALKRPTGELAAQALAEVAHGA